MPFLFCLRNIDPHHVAAIGYAVTNHVNLRACAEPHLEIGSPLAIAAVYLSVFPRRSTRAVPPSVWRCAPGLYTLQISLSASTLFLSKTICRPSSPPLAGSGVVALSARATAFCP